MRVVQFNRSAREYQIVDSTTGALLGAYPSGPAGRPAAERHALSMDAPDVSAALQQFEAQYRAYLPALKLRPLHGAQIAATPDSIRPNGGPNSFYVRSQSRPGIVYSVTPPHCECSDYENARDGLRHSAPAVHGAPMCKHVIALKLRTPAPEITPPSLWTAFDPVVDLFPVDSAELEQMYQLWPNAYGPSSPAESRTYSTRPTDCCGTGRVGQITHHQTHNEGETYCFACRQYIGAY